MEQSRIRAVVRKTFESYKKGELTIYDLALRMFEIGDKMGHSSHNIVNVIAELREIEKEEQEKSMRFLGQSVHIH